MSDKTKKARVLLLNPPTAPESSEPLLGLGYLAAMLRKYGHSVKIVDATAPFKPVSSAEIEDIVKEYSPHFIGVTLTINYIPQTYAYLATLKKLGVPIVAGGPHVNPLPEEALDHAVDIVVLGEGEITIVELADYLVGNRTALDDIKGLCYKKTDGKIHRTAPRELIENLDDIPFPSFEDFPIQNYTGSKAPDSNRIFWSIFSSRGCPFNCIFCCSHNVFENSYRIRSAENIFEEIKHLVDSFGATYFAFQDDEVMLHKKRVRKLCELIISNNLKVKISVRSRIDSLDTELLKLCKQAGLYRISFGVESWNDETLQKINKKYNVSGIEKGLSVLDEAEFPHVSFNNIIGWPWETRENYKKNLQVLKRMPKSLQYFSNVVTPNPYPNTVLYNTYHEEYGFTNWWLDPDKHTPHWKRFVGGNYRPVFYRLAKTILAAFVPDLYWQYSKKQRKDIEFYSWGVFSLFARRHLGLLSSTSVVMLCRLSAVLWRISPRLERITLGGLSSKLLDKIALRLSFVNAG